MLSRLLQHLCLAVVILACGSGSSGSGAVRSAAEAHEAVVHIEAWVAAVAPGSSSAQLFVWQGTGFVIDPTGTVVTAAHLVNTASAIEVFLPKRAQPVVGGLVALSECSDIAVLSLPGTNHAYLDWFTGAIEPGLAVSVAGFPNGNPEYSVSQGEVVARWPVGNFPWASVASTVQHTAPTSPGASGAPVIAADGRVVAVTLAYEADNQDLNFGIDGEVARQVVADLQHGAKPAGIGVSAQVWKSSDASLAGVWVEAVAADSPAHRATIQAGDIVTAIADVSLREDPTLRSYCEVLRNTADGEPIAIEVIRPSTGERLRGEVHGSPLEATDDVDQDFSITTGRASGAPWSLVVASDPRQPSIGPFTTVGDDQGVLTLEVPTGWSDVRSKQLASGDVATVNLVAVASSRDVDKLQSLPGVEVGVFVLNGRSPGPIFDNDPILRSLEQRCDRGGPRPYDDGTYVGELNVWTTCEGTSPTSITITAHDDDAQIGVVIALPVTTAADLHALERVMATLKVAPPSTWPADS